MNWAVSLPPARFTDSKELKLRPSRVLSSAPVRIRVLPASEATRLSELLLPVRVSNPETMPLMAVAPPVVVVPALLAMPLRVSETAEP